MQAWDLTQIEAPGGTIDPTVLMTDDGARAIMLRLEAGQELSDHQVRERAWLVVVEGEAEIRSGDEVVGVPLLLRALAALFLRCHRLDYARDTTTRPSRITVWTTSPARW